MHNVKAKQTQEKLLTTENQVTFKNALSAP